MTNAAQCIERDQPYTSGPGLRHSKNIPHLVRLSGSRMSWRQTPQRLWHAKRAAVAHNVWL